MRTGEGALGTVHAAPRASGSEVSHPPSSGSQGVEECC